MLKLIFSIKTFNIFSQVVKLLHTYCGEGTHFSALVDYCMVFSCSLSLSFFLIEC